MEFRLHNFLLRFAASLALLIVFTFTASAETEDKLGLKFYGSFLYTERVPNALFFFSDIEKNDTFELRKALRNHDIDILVLSSKGGSVWEGLTMAGMIYDKKLITYVPKLGLNGEGNCASACAFMFFGGSTRIADGKLGVHQFYSGSASDSAKIGTTQKVAQFTVSEIIGYLNEFTTPPFVYERMFQQSEMYYFDKKELEKIARVVEPLKQEDRSSISSFINDFKVELASLDVDEDQQVTEPVKKVEPKKTPTPKKKTPVVTERTKPKEIKKPSTSDDIQEPVKTKVDIVKSIQTELNRLNCNAGTVDGVIGSQTKKALKRYGKAKGSEVIDTDLTDQEFLTELRYTQVKCEKISQQKEASITHKQKLRLSYSCREVSLFKRDKSETELVIYVGKTTYQSSILKYDNPWRYFGEFKTDNEEYSLFTHPFEWKDIKKRHKGGSFGIAFFIDAEGLSRRAPTQLWYPSGEMVINSNGLIKSIKAKDEYGECYFEAGN